MLIGTDIIQQRLHDANQWHKNIKLQSQIGTSVPFLDVLVSNQQGVLHTAVYHKPSAEPYVVPFLSDHPRHTFANVIQTALVRAIRYSSIFETFTKEQIAIELMLLYNGLVLLLGFQFFILNSYFSYPIEYIDKQFRKVLNDSVPSSSLLPIIDDEHQFHQLRRRLMGQPTPRQSQIEAQIQQYKENNDDQQEEQPEQTLPSSTSTKQQDKKKFLQDKVIMHYTHENRFTSMKRDMHEIFREAFKDLGIDAVRFIVGHRNSPSSQRELIRKRPHINLLKLKHKGSHQSFEWLSFSPLLSKLLQTNPLPFSFQIQKQPSHQ